MDEIEKKWYIRFLDNAVRLAPQAAPQMLLLGCVVILVTNEVSYVVLILFAVGVLLQIIRTIEAIIKKRGKFYIFLCCFIVVGYILLSAILCSL